VKLDFRPVGSWVRERGAGIATRLGGLSSRATGSELKALPILSLSIVALWFLAALWVQLSSPGHLRLTRSEMERATSIAVSNPVVEVPGHYLPIVRAVLPRFENDELLGFLRKNQAAGEVASLQTHFDEVAATAAKLLESHPTRTLGVLPAELSLGGFATHVLIHAGWLHLLATVLLFLLAAPLLEERWGRPLLGGTIVLLALAGGAVFYAVNPTANRAFVGGSAVVAGLVAACVVTLENEEVDFLGWLGPLAGGELIAPAWTLAVPLALYELALWWAIQGSLPRSVDSAVGYPAHAAGAVLGCAVAFAVTKLGLVKEQTESQAPAPGSRQGAQASRTG